MFTSLAEAAENRLHVQQIFFYLANTQPTCQPGIAARLEARACELPIHSLSTKAHLVLSPCEFFPLAFTLPIAIPRHRIVFFA